MAEKLTQESGSERLWRFARNINVLGAAAIAGVALVVPGPNVVLASWASLNAVQAGGFELLRRHSHNQASGRTGAHP